jgi:hypothetical protein
VLTSLSHVATCRRVGVVPELSTLHALLKTVFDSRNSTRISSTCVRSFSSAIFDAGAVVDYVANLLDRCRPVSLLAPIGATRPLRGVSCGRSLFDSVEADCICGREDLRVSRPPLGLHRRCAAFAVG